MTARRDAEAETLAKLEEAADGARTTPSSRPRAQRSPPGRRRTAPGRVTQLGPIAACAPGLLGLSVGLALADSSIVTLALPEILGRFDVGITTVAWVLTSFNLVLALVAVPAALVARRRPRPAFFAGALVFAAASLACGLAGSFELLVAARCVQAVGAAFVVVAALDLLAATTGSGPRAARVWVAAGILGAAFGPGAGGILTELLGWRSIFIVQVPLALVPLGAAPGSPRRDAGASRPRGKAAPERERCVAPSSGGLVAALFLLVLLLVSGWRLSPAAAGLVVTVLPLAAIAAARVPPRSVGVGMRMASGVVLVAGGLTALALLPRAGWVWTIAPQLLVGRGNRPRPRRPDRESRRRPRRTGRARWLDARRTARRSRARPAPPRAGAHVGSRAQQRRGGAGRHRRGARQPDPGARQAARRAGRARRGGRGRGQRRVARRRGGARGPAAPTMTTEH